MNLLRRVGFILVKTRWLIRGIQSWGILSSNSCICVAHSPEWTSKFCDPSTCMSTTSVTASSILACFAGLSSVDFFFPTTRWITLAFRWIILYLFIFELINKTAMTLIHAMYLQVALKFEKNTYRKELQESLILKQRR